MRSGFLKSDDPKVSRLAERAVVQDETLGKRKYRMEDFEFERNVGCDSTSQVWHVTLKAKPEDSYALKIFNVQKVTQTNFVKFVQQERKAMLTLNSPGHPNVIRMVDTFRDDQNVCLLYEYAEGGDLWEEIKNIGVPEKHIARSLVRQLLSGLEYIHENNIVHRDLKCENIVIKDGLLKIVDFGTSVFEKDITKEEPASGACNKVNKEQETAQSTSANPHHVKGSAPMNNVIHRERREFKNYVGTPNFMPPEAISNIASGYAGDLWSLGCTIYQLLLGINCFTGSSTYFISKNVKENKPEFPETFDQDAKDFICSFLITDPKKRMGLSEAKRHSYLSCNDAMVQVPTSMKRFDHLDSRLRKECCKIQEAIFDLNIKRESATEADHKQIMEGISWLKQQGIPTLAENIAFNYERTKRQLKHEMEEARKYMGE